MGRYKFARSSIERLQEVHNNLSAVMYQAKEISDIDFDVSCGYRSIEDQKALYDLGRSQLDGAKNKSMHNFTPALAVDIYAYNGKYADYSIDKMEYLASVIKKAAEDLNVKIVWGGDWKEFIDMRHYELG